MSEPKVSVVIINKNDRAVADTLTALRDDVRCPLPTEVVVIDASSGKLDDIAKQFPDVQWFDFKSRSGRRFTIPEQRNTGVQKARGDIIVYTDASCVPQADWLELLLAPILSGEEQIVAGSTVSRGGPTIHDQNHQHLGAGQKYLQECPTINLAFTRKAFEEIGGFDERFDYGSDVDFSWRAADKGYKVRYVPQAIVAHDWGKASEDAKRAYRYGIARARLYKKHPHRYKQLFGQDVTALIYPVYILGLPLTIVFWPYPLLILIPLAKNIRKQPHRVLQKHIVYGLGVLRELVRV
jgi:GT2 family glycosyltransferase